MNRICCIMDFDGFHVSGQFLVRELGYIGMSDSSANSIRFNLQPYEKNLSETDWKTIDYVTENISGLPFLPGEDEETIALTLLESKVRAIYDLYRTSQKDVVAFKGGKVEKNVLERLGIPFQNLEEFGCPKYDVLKTQNKFETCGYHLQDKHCPLAEVTAFRSWMQSNFQNVNKSKQN